jgi:hypothetical protein
MGTKAICKEYSADPKARLKAEVIVSRQLLASNDPSGIVVKSLNVVCTNGTIQIAYFEPQAAPVGPVWNAKKNVVRLVSPLKMHFTNCATGSCGHAMVLGDVSLKFNKDGSIRGSLRYSGVIGLESTSTLAPGTVAFRAGGKCKGGVCK